MKETAASMEKITYTMVIHKHLYGEETIFSTMYGKLVINPLGKWLVLIRRGNYKSAAGYSRWSYEPVSYLWPDADHGSDYSDNETFDEGRKEQDKPDNKG